ncbi:MAG: restriction endonuclease [Firmicutes bacterium]|nr:restriction endonuclease [Bacillota bacterium]
MIESIFDWIFSFAFEFRYIILFSIIIGIILLCLDYRERNRSYAKLAQETRILRQQIAELPQKEKLLRQIDALNFDYEQLQRRFNKEQRKADKLISEIKACKNKNEELTLQNDEFTFQNGELIFQNEELTLQNEELTFQNKKLTFQNKDLSQQNTDLQDFFTKHNVEQLVKQNEALHSLVEEKLMQYPWLAKEYADYQYIFEERQSKILATKANPAIKAAAQLKNIAKEKRELQQLCKLQEYQLNFYEKVFPWLEDIKETDIYEIWQSTQKTAEYDETDEYHTLSKWLSPEEYENLSTQEKYQLALDRYQKRHKSNWEVGIEFERYIGYKFEMAGENVKYIGATKGLEDMGRDLIVEKPDKIRVIQCKRWAQHKTIHEKHIFQLYGSMVMLGINNPQKPLEGLLITTAPLSPTAQQCADYLHIRIKTINPESLANGYPVIKCNISRKDNTKIYHLPFDQQYDRVVIEPSRGEFYAHTIAEAEEAGFRRAWKHIC